jgi:hypothetical protein
MAMLVSGSKPKPRTWKGTSLHDAAAACPVAVAVALTLPYGWLVDVVVALVLRQTADQATPASSDYPPDRAQLAPTCLPVSLHDVVRCAQRDLLSWLEGGLLGFEQRPRPEPAAAEPRQLDGMPDQRLHLLPLFLACAAHSR